MISSVSSGELISGSAALSSVVADGIDCTRLSSCGLHAKIIIFAITSLRAHEVGNNLAMVAARQAS